MRLSLLAKYFSEAVACAILTISLAACNLILEDPMCDIADREAETVTISFRMISSNVGSSRADSQDHEETSSSWAAYEDRITTDNIAFFIFTQTGDFVTKVTDLTSESNPNTTIQATLGSITVTTKIPKADLTPLFEGSDDAEKLNLRLVVLANINNIAEGQTTDNVYDELATDMEAVQTSQPTDYDLFLEQVDTKLYYSTTDLPSGTSSPPIWGNVNPQTTRFIPMFGMTDFEVYRTALEASQDEQRHWLPDVYMLRSVAKIVVIDNARPEGEDYPRVESVSFVGSTYMARILPAGVETDPLQYVNGNQVHTTNPYPSSTSSDNLPTTVLGFATATSTEAMAYIPEQAITAESGDTPASPLILITIVTGKDEDGKEISQEYTVPMRGTYNGTALAFGTNILRNHIYTLSVSLNPGLVLSAHVVDYKGVELEPVFGKLPENEDDSKETPSGE